MFRQEAVKCFVKSLNFSDFTKIKNTFVTFYSVHLHCITGIRRKMITTNPYNYSVDIPSFR